MLRYLKGSLLLGLCILSLGSAVSGEPCGGSLEGNSGGLEHADHTSAGSESQTCIWTIQLHSLTDFQLQLHDIGGFDTSISVFNKESAQNALPIVPPLHELNSTSVGLDIRATGTQLFLLLRPSIQGVPRRFSLTWQGTSPSSVSTEASSYFVSESGSVSINNAGSQIVVTIITPSAGAGQTKNLQAKVNGYENECAPNLVLSIFQVNPNGYLREVTRTCGPPISLSGVEPPLIAIVVKTSLLYSETVSIAWENTMVSPTTTTTEPTTPTDSTTEGPVDGCGGVLQLEGSSSPELLSYKQFSNYEAGEQCVWVIQCPARFIDAQVRLLEDGFEPSEAYVTIFGRAAPNVPYDNLAQLHAGNRSTFHISWPVFTATFVSHSSGGQGFLLDFRCIGSTNDRHHTVLHFTEPHGSYSYPPQGGNYNHYDFVTIAVNPWPHRGDAWSWLAVTIEFYDIAITSGTNLDVLEVHALNINDGNASATGYELRELLSGTSTDWIHIENEGFSPILLVFRTDGLNLGRGFNFTYASIAASKSVAVSGDDMPPAYETVVSDRKKEYKIGNLDVKFS